MYTKLNTKTTVNVIDRYGYELDTLTLTNTAAAELYPDMEHIRIQWTADKSARPKREELMKPVQYAGKDWYGNFAWGSAVKRGQTIGLLEDSLTHMTKTDEDGQRVQRWLFASGIFGGFKGDLKIGILQPGELIGGRYPVEDGFGYIKASLLKRFGRPERVELGTSRDNWTYWQRIPWEAVKDEMAPLVNDRAIESARPELMLRSMGHSYEQKQRLFELENDMIEHPFVASSLNKGAQSFFARLCSSVHLDGKYRTAVPTTASTVCCKGFSGQLVVDRSPIDSNGSIQAVEVEPNPEEEERITGMEVVQVSLSAVNFHSKGCLGAIPDELMDYDIVICSEDIKMASSDLGTLKDVRNLFEIELKDVVVPFLMIWSGKSLAGVNAKWAKDKMGLDHDGDGIRMVDANELPMFWQAVSELDPGLTPKLPKSKTPVTAEGRAQMIAKSMTNLVGMATNVAGGTFMVKDREFLAKKLGFENASKLNNRLNFFIKVGTDGFKTAVDQVAVEKEIAAVQSGVNAAYGISAPWSRWDGDNWAFARSLPCIIDAVEDGKYLVDGKWVELDDQQAKVSIFPFMDGAIAQIARIALPLLAPHWEAAVDMKPLTAYTHWVNMPDEALLKEAEEVQFWFNARIGRVQWSDPKNVVEFKLDYAQRLEEWEGDPAANAEALWWVAHSSRGKDATAASVFMGFPEECERIVVEKPGAKVEAITVIGVAYQVPSFRGGQVAAEIKPWVQSKDGKRVIRMVVCGNLPGQQRPKDKAMPEDLIGFVAQNTAQPLPGHYVLNFSRGSQNSWVASLA
jgi:hypothetical protein